MADNKVLPPTGTGTADIRVATDEVTYSGQTADISLVRPVLVTGSEGSKTVVELPGDATNGLDVDVTRLPPFADPSATQTGTWTSATGAGTAITLTVSGYKSVSILFTRSGSISSGSAVFEDSTDGGTTWAGLMMMATDSANGVSITQIHTYTSGLTSPILFQVGTGGLTDIRVVVNATLGGGGSVSWILIAGMGDVMAASSIPSSPVAHDVNASSFNPLLIGGYARSTAPSDVSTDSDAVRAWFLRNGAQATVVTAAGALIGGDAANGLDVDVTRIQEAVSAAQTATWDSATATDSAVTLDCTIYPAALATLDLDGGTIASGQINVEVSPDGGTTWVQGPTDQVYVDVNGQLLLVAFDSFEGTLAIHIDTRAYNRVRLRLFDAIVGTVVVSVRLFGVSTPLNRPVGLSRATLEDSAGNQINIPGGVLLVSDTAVATSLAIMDDWDESDRAKVNPIVGQAGVQGGAGAVTALTQRVAIATDANAISGTVTAAQATAANLNATVVGTGTFAVQAAATNAAASQADGHSANIGALADADTASTLTGLLKKLKALLNGGLPAALGAQGALKVEGVASGTAVPISGSVMVSSAPSTAVTNAGTFATQVDGSALTALQLIDDPVFADEASFTTATSKVHMAGVKAVTSGSAPDDAGGTDRAVSPVANRNRVPFVIGGDPGVITLKHTNITTAVTDAAIVTVSTGNKIVVTRISVTLDNASTVFPTLLIGFGTANTPTTTGVLVAHGGVPAGGGITVGDGSGILGIGADNEDLRVTTTGNATGNGLQICVTYYLVVA